MKKFIWALVLVTACAIPSKEELNKADFDGCLHDCGDEVVDCANYISAQKKMCLCYMDKTYWSEVEGCVEMCADDDREYVECLGAAIDCAADCAEKVEDAL